MKKIILFLYLLLPAGMLSGAEVKPIQKLKPEELESRLESDAQSVLVEREGLQKVIQFMDSRRDLFPSEVPNSTRLLNREEKEVVWNTWQRFLDYFVVLDGTEKYHASFQQLKGAPSEDSFLIGYAAMLAQYRSAIEFISRAEKNPELDKVLNDPVPELGLPGGAYAQLKFRFLNVGRATEFAGREMVLKLYTEGRRPELRKAIAEDNGVVWNAEKWEGQILTAKNAFKVVQRGAGTAWLPVQTGVSEWMGHTKVYRVGKCLISPEQIVELQKKLEPGDILLERREWFVSNIGLPGFWSHAAIYIGTAEERQKYFADAGVELQGRDHLEQTLEAQNPEKYPLSKAPQEEGHPVRILEAIGQGVSFTSLEHSAGCDAIAVLRPRLTKAEKATALLRAFHYAGRPYDFNFDFSTDAELVCTELVYKSYEPRAGFKGMTFPTVEMLGRRVTPANEMAKEFDSQCGTAEQQSDLVVFLDEREAGKRAVTGTEAEFRKSWTRPKWHVMASGK